VQEGFINTMVCLVIPDNPKLAINYKLMIQNYNVIILKMIWSRADKTDIICQ